VISEKGFCFIVFIVALQVVYFFVDVNLTQTVSPKKQEWLAMQSKIDSIKALNSEYCQKYTHSIPILLLITKASLECLFRKLIGY
jgi:hypothetical protein